MDSPCTFNIPLQNKTAPRQEVYCLRNKSDLLTFKEKTTHTNKFSNCFTEEGGVEKEGKKWLKTLQNTIQVSGLLNVRALLNVCPKF